MEELGKTCAGPAGTARLYPGGYSAARATWEADEERRRDLSLVAALGVDPEPLLASSSPSPGEARKVALALGLGRHAWCLVHDDQFAARCTTATWRVASGAVSTG